MGPSGVKKGPDIGEGQACVWFPGLAWLGVARPASQCAAACPPSLPPWPASSPPPLGDNTTVPAPVQVVPKDAVGIHAPGTLLCLRVLRQSTQSPAPCWGRLLPSCSAGLAGSGSPRRPKRVRNAGGSWLHISYASGAGAVTVAGFGTHCVPDTQRCFAVAPYEVGSPSSLPAARSPGPSWCTAKAAQRQLHWVLPAARSPEPATVSRTARRPKYHDCAHPLWCLWQAQPRGSCSTGRAARAGAACSHI
jgi:hypothetical protein